MGVAISRFLGIDDASAVAALDNVDRVFDDIADRIADGRPFLLGDRFTAADLTFAALSAPMLVPGPIRLAAAPAGGDARRRRPAHPPAAVPSRG